MRFSKTPENFSGPKTFQGAFRCFSRVPKSVSQNTRKCPELPPDIFGSAIFINDSRMPVIYIRNKRCDAKMHMMFYFQRISILLLILQKFPNQKTSTNAQISAFAAQQRELNIFAQCMWVVFLHNMIYDSSTFFSQPA